MWIPKTEAEILQAIETKSIEETSIFDAKKELGTNNKEIAKDIAAMANYGGVIMYGIDEDQNGYPTIPNPIPLSGQPERITLIAQTGIVEPLKIVARAIQSAHNPALGYIVVVVPPSERAPHMVEVKGENRYYGRTAKTNFPLSEGEVAQLYQRRQSWEVDRDKLLEQEIKRIGTPSEPNTTYLYVIVRPVFHEEGLLRRIEKTTQGIPYTLTRLIDESRVHDRDRSGDDFFLSTSWRQQIEGFFGGIGFQLGSGLDTTSSIEVDFDGTIHYVLKKASYIQSDEFMFSASQVAMHIASLLQFAGKVYNRTQYVGMVDICIALDGLKDSLIFSTATIGYFPKPYMRNDYRKTKRTSALSLEQDYLNTARDLFSPLMNAMTQGAFDPFNI